jgi:hypothetical protein
MALFDSEETGLLPFARRRAPPLGGHRPNTIIMEVEDPDTSRVIGEADGDNDIVEIAVDTVEAEIDEAGALTGRGRVLGRKVKRILRQRQRNYDNFFRRDSALAARQASLEQRGQLAHQEPSFLRQQQAQQQQAAQQQLSNLVVGKPLFTAQSIAAGGSATFILTTQYDLVVDKVFFSASVANSLGLFLITGFQIGVDNLGSNPESSSGFSANMLDPANTQPSIFAGRTVRAQSPIRFVAQNTGAATSVLSVMVSGRTNAAQMLG